MNRHTTAPTGASALLAALLAASLAACGGGATDTTAQASAADATNTSSAADQATTDTTAATNTAATSTTTAAATDSAADAAIAQSSASPTFHMAPAILSEPSTIDAGGTNASARRAPQRFEIDPSVANLSTRGLTPQRLAQQLATGASRATTQSSASAAAARVVTGAVYTPAQIRAAYGLPDLPTVGAAVSASVAATLGAGQTIYIIDAYHDATALADLNAFSTRFGLSNCTGATVASTAALPLAAAGSACTLSVVYSTSAGAMTATAPAYNSGWAPESKLDVQWAHAIAPLARIVLIETPDAMTNNLLGAIELADKLGAGVVSMSFGLADPGWAATVDSKFTTTGMTYVAAAGDIGGQVDWPAVSPHVLAVGGTGMDWSGSGTRYEQAWSSGGGGVSLYEALPTWQSGLTPFGGTALAKRAVSDVSFNANPLTGQYVALTQPNASSVTWSAYGGTSIATPQWAGIVAIANAIRVANAQAVLGDFHTLLYKTIAATPGDYAAAFYDVVDGTNGSCASCKAGTGFDTATGWGTPNVSGLLPLLTGVASPADVVVATPTVPGGALVGRHAVALTQSLGVTAPAGVTTSYALSSAPSGLTVDTTGTLHWAAPVTGSYAFTAKATTSSGASASASYSLKVIPNTVPVFSGATVLTATAGTSFGIQLVASNPNSGTLTFSATGMPSGMALSSGGDLTWAAPVAGTYTIAATVRDSYGLSASCSFRLTVAASSSTTAAPTLTSMTVVAKTGTALALTLRGRDANGDAMTYSMTSAPAGATLTSAGAFSWPSPTAGTHAISVVVRNTSGATGAATLTLSIS